MVIIYLKKSFHHQSSNTMTNPMQSTKIQQMVREQNRIRASIVNSPFFSKFLIFLPPHSLKPFQVFIISFSTALHNLGISALSLVKRELVLLPEKINRRKAQMVSIESIQVFLGEFAFRLRRAL